MKAASKIVGSALTPLTLTVIYNDKLKKSWQYYIRPSIGAKYIRFRNNVYHRAL